MSHKLVIGLTGSLASGKSTAAALLQEHGARVIDVDRLGHEALRFPGSSFDKLIRAFGPEIRAADGRIDSRRLAAVAFKSKTDYRRLCRIVYPYIGSRLASQIAAFRKRRDAGVLVLDAAVLLEAGWHRQVDRVVLVVADASQRLQRVRARGSPSPAQARQRLAFQWPDERKQRYADYIIENRSTVAALRRHVNRLWRLWHEIRDDPAGRRIAHR